MVQMAEWHFEFEGRDCKTIRDFADVVHEIAVAGDLDRAAKFVSAYVRRQQEHMGGGRQLAIDIVRSNIGYLSGYYDTETMAKIQGVFACDHPIFGRAQPTPDEAVAAGKAWAESVVRRGTDT